MAPRLTSRWLGGAGFVTRRLLWTIPVLWAAVSLLFLMFFVVPGDRTDAIVGGDRVLAPEARQAVRAHLGLDRPLVDQYGRYWGRLLHGDLGRSYTSGREVSTILASTVPASARLAFWAVVVEVVVGVGVGVALAVHRSRAVQALGALWTALLLAVPVFVVGLVLQLGLGIVPYQHGWPAWLRFPTSSSGAPDTWVLGVLPTGGQWRYLVLPAVTVAMVSTALVARLTRSGLRSTLSSDYVRGARAKGLPARRVLVRHALPPALVPVLAFVGVDVVNLFGSAVVTETIFNWPGMGSALAEALRRSDAPVVLGLTVVLAVAYVLVGLVVDVVHQWIDPRLRRRRGSRSMA